MRRWIIIWILALSLINTQGQEFIGSPEKDHFSSTTAYLNSFLSVNESNEQVNTQSFEKLLKKLENTRKRRNSDYAFLRTVFYKTQTNLLLEYDRLATMDETLNAGKYGCLTGTAIYAVLLEHFGYDYKIIELPNHVFIHLSVDNNSYVFESTLPFGGFMRTTVEMEKLLEQPWVSQRRISELSTVGDWFQDFKSFSGNYNTINLKQLAGLQYFNESAKFYLKKDYSNAMDLAFKAYELYPSERNEKLMQLIINKILKYDMIKQELKSQYLDQYVSSVKNQKLSQTK